jgi:SpoVK/Ycf46/Vps4 family AAA+-type ATPase
MMFLLVGFCASALAFNPAGSNLTIAARPHRRFEQAYLHQPSIIFFDEIDGLAPVRSSKQDQIHSSVVSTLLGLMDGLQSRGKVVVIGATNRIDSIDPALRRPGRFDREFLFPMPTEKARRSILQIHTDKWSPKPAPELLDELASKCTGYCGADLKALCAEAALSAVNRSYPQIYHCDQKLLIDEKTVQVQRRDFDSARRKVVPSLHRSSQNYAKPLGGTLEPLLGPVAGAVVRELRSGFFPFCEAVAAFRSAGDTDSSIAEQFTAGGGDGGGAAAAASSVHSRPPPAWSAVHIHGPPECGQQEVAAAVLQLLDQSGQSVPVHGLDLVSLSSSVSARTLEEAAVGVVHQAAVVTPSILFLPHLQVLMRTGYEQLRTIIMGAIE